MSANIPGYLEAGADATGSPAPFALGAGQVQMSPGLGGLFALTVLAVSSWWSGQMIPWEQLTCPPSWLKVLPVLSPGVSPGARGGRGPTGRKATTLGAAC